MNKKLAALIPAFFLARRQVVAWVRAHQGLANGVRNPGKWLESILQVAAGYKKLKE